MALRLRTWTSRLLNLGAGVFLCAAVGCSTTKADRGPNGPNLPPVKAMGPGNQVSNPPTSPAYNNLAGPGQGGALPPAQPNNSSALMNRGNPNPPMLGVQMPPMNAGNPAAYGQQNQQTVAPTQGVAPNGYPQQNQMQITPPPPVSQQQQQIQPPLMQNQAPSTTIPQQDSPSSMSGLTIPDSLPTNAREAASASGPGLLPASFNAPALDPAPTAPKEKPVRVLGGITPPSSPGQRATVVTTPVEIQPVLDAPITVVPPK